MTLRRNIGGPRLPLCEPTSDDESAQMVLPSNLGNYVTYRSIVEPVPLGDSLARIAGAGAGAGTFSLCVSTGSAPVLPVPRSPAVSDDGTHTHTSSLSPTSTLFSPPRSNVSTAGTSRFPSPLPLPPPKSSFAQVSQPRTLNDVAPFISDDPNLWSFNSHLEAIVNPSDYPLPALGLNSDASEQYIKPESIVDDARKPEATSKSTTPPRKGQKAEKKYRQGLQASKEDLGKAVGKAVIAAGISLPTSPTKKDIDVAATELIYFLVNRNSELQQRLETQEQEMQKLRCEAEFFRDNDSLRRQSANLHNAPRPIEDVQMQDQVN